MENSTAKTMVTCDNCKQNLRPELDTDGENIEAKFKNSQGDLQVYSYCDDICLEQWLSKRNKPKKKKKAKASYAYDRSSKTMIVDLGI